MIELDLRTFRQSRPNGNVTGVIFLNLEGSAFPEQGWSDFPVIILGWWTEAFLELEAHVRREVQWRFMDGSYGATLTEAESSGSTTAIDSQELRRSLLNAAERAVAHCEQHRMLSGDLETLRDNLERLKANKTVPGTGASRFAQIEIRRSAAANSRR